MNYLIEIIFNIFVFKYYGGRMTNTKELIIDAAFKLFLIHGYNGVSISLLSNAIDMTKGALYHYFRSKEELFTLVVDKYFYIPTFNINIESESLYEFIHQGNVFAEGVQNFYFKDIEAFSPLDYLSFFSDAFRHYPGFAKKKKKLINVEVEKTIFILQKAIETGEIREDIDVPLVASSFFSINMGLISNLVRENSIEESINVIRKQNLEFYKLLKRY